MAIPDETIRRLTEPPSAELLQRVARELYETEPLRGSMPYGGGDFVAEWDSPMLSDGARECCRRYAATVIASWQRAVLEG
ncbi:hypothetical protein OJF2_50390 [Aquisphaera giovannonii]|uniref:Uncharacterized protein n=1 Tax=Aquisphaera giovannonii TaxID=406548 RepID=A0A5B9W8S0_9BACT|nr:hypothetical protein [Aquisphaera giovannonii]QEH36475.1 hypothetical protein OJF2_50390 [Aquisphaera giovannonii]